MPKSTLERKNDQDLLDAKVEMYEELASLIRAIRIVVDVAHGMLVEESLRVKRQR